VELAPGCLVTDPKLRDDIDGDLLMHGTDDSV
jgi:hypothetical protein